MDDSIKLIADSFGTDRVKLDYPIAEYTSLGVGGPAKLFFIAFTVKELVKIITFCRELKIPYFIFGTGSKIMIADSGFDGVVVKNRTKNISIVSVKGKVSKFGIGVEEAMVEVESGVSIGKLVEFLDSQGLSGQEFIGISGSVGGNIFLNLALQAKVKSIKVLNTDCDIEQIEMHELQLRKHIVLSVVLKIKAKE